MASALGRAAARRAIPRGDAERTWRAATEMWDDLVVIEPTPALMRSASELAQAQALSTSAALHVSAAELVSAGGPLVTFDATVARAARAAHRWVLPS